MEIDWPFRTPTETHVVLPPELTLLDLCAGVGQLGNAVHAGLARLGLRCRTLCHVERDAAAAALLVARMESAELGPAAVWSDLTTFDGRPLLGRVAGVCAGLPCPAYSSAGKRAGNADPRAWGEGFDPGDVATWGPVPHALRIVAECRPRFVFFENVPQWLTSGAYEPVGDELRRLGYGRQVCAFVAAEDVDYPHLRERAFVLAVGDGFGEGLAQPDGVRRHDGAELPPAKRGRLPLAHGERPVGQRPVGGRPVDGADGRDNAGRGRKGLADSAGRESGVGQRLGFPSGRGGEPRAEGRIEVMADPRRAGDEQRDDAGSVAAVPGEVQGGPRQRERPRGDTGGGDNALGHADRQRPGEQGDRRQQQRRHGSGGVRLPVHPPARGTDLAAVSEALAKAAAIDVGRHVRPGHRGSASRVAAAAACRLARRIWRDWATVAAVDPSLMPAVEPEVSMVVDGHTYGSADLLRAGGNCVVADAATVAFVDLWNDIVG